MIDRYAIYSDFRTIAERYNSKLDDEFTIPNFNASPAQALPVITNISSGSGQIVFYYWGTVKEWSNNNSISPKLLSADASTLLTKSTLKNALLKRRCLIPLNGFYLWKRYLKKRKTAHYFSLPNQEIFSLPAIWEEYDDMNGKTHHTFKLIEIPNYLKEDEFGTLTPAVLSQDFERKWMDDYSSEEELLEMINDVSTAKELVNHPVSSVIVDVTKNNPEMIKPHSQMDQLGNYTLFN